MVLTAGIVIPDRCLVVLQDIANDGLYHPSVNMSIAARVVVNYTPSDYPTDAQRSNGFVCGCTNYYNNPCRAEFRKVQTLKWTPNSPCCTASCPCHTAFCS